MIDYFCIVSDMTYKKFDLRLYLVVKMFWSEVSNDTFVV